METKVLIVDDEQEILSLLEEGIKEVGYITKTVDNARDVVETFEKFQPDLVLLDIWLGDSSLDGINILKKIRAKTSDVQCIMMSGHGNTSTAFESMQAGAFSFVEKPFKLQRLLLELEKAKEHLFLARRVATLTNISNQVRTSDFGNNITTITGADFTTLSSVQNNKQVRYDVLWSLFSQYYQAIAQQLIDASSEILVVYKQGFFIEEFALWALKSQLNYITWQRDCEGLDIFDNFVVIDCKAKINLSLLDQMYNILLARENKNFVLVYNYHLASQELQQVLAELSSLLNDKRYVKLFFTTCVSAAFKKKITIPGVINVISDLSNALEQFLHLYAQHKPKISSEVNALLNRHWEYDLRHIEALAIALSFMYTHSFTQISKDMVTQIFKDDMFVDIDSHDIIPMHTDSWQNILNLPLKEAKSAFEKLYLNQQIQRFDGNIRKVAEVIQMDRTALYRKIKEIS